MSQDGVTHSSRPGFFLGDSTLISRTRKEERTSARSVTRTSTARGGAGIIRSVVLSRGQYYSSNGFLNVLDSVFYGLTSGEIVNGTRENRQSPGGPGRQVLNRYLRSVRGMIKPSFNVYLWLTYLYESFMKVKRTL